MYLVEQDTRSISCSSPCFVNLTCALVGRFFFFFFFFFFCCLSFYQLPGLCPVFPVSLPLFFLFLRPCLIHARMPGWGRAFVHGHTFLLSWSRPMTLVVHGATFLSNLLYDLSSWNEHLLNPTYNNNLIIIIILTYNNNFFAPVFCFASMGYLFP